MRGKLAFIAGVGAGIALTLRLSEKQIGSIKDFTSKIAQSESLNDAKRVASSRFEDTLRDQGSRLIDFVAQNLKSQLAKPKWDDFSGETRSEDTGDKASTTSTDFKDYHGDDGDHVIIDGRVVP